MSYMISDGSRYCHRTKTRAVEIVTSKDQATLFSTRQIAENLLAKATKKLSGFYLVELSPAQTADESSGRTRGPVRKNDTNTSEAKAQQLPEQESKARQPAAQEAKAQQTPVLNEQVQQSANRETAAEAENIIPSPEPDPGSGGQRSSRNRRSRRNGRRRRQNADSPESAAIQNSQAGTEESARRAAERTENSSAQDSARRAAERAENSSAQDSAAAQTQTALSDQTQVFSAVQSPAVSSGNVPNMPVSSSRQIQANAGPASGQTQTAAPVSSEPVSTSSPVSSGPVQPSAAVLSDSVQAASSAPSEQAEVGFSHGSSPQASAINKNGRVSSGRQNRFSDNRNQQRQKNHPDNRSAENKRRMFTSAERNMIYNRTEGHCGICGRFIPLEEYTIDHIIPLSKGGTNDPENLQACCSFCNKAKDDSVGDDFLRRIERIYLYQCEQKYGKKHVKKLKKILKKLK